MVTMTRNENAPSSTQRNNSSAYRFYEKTYNGIGPQEWIFLPDVGQYRVVLSFPSGGDAIIEGTASPPDVVMGVATSPAGAYAPVFYPLTDAVTDTTAILVQGETAIRVNVLGGVACISVRA